MLLFIEVAGDLDKKKISVHFYLQSAIGKEENTMQWRLAKTMTKNQIKAKRKVEHLHKTRSNLDIGFNISRSHFWLSTIGSYTISQ